jgi:regulator of protease activity HflC (stomatin/prohibitin superfamily)
MSKWILLTAILIGPTGCATAVPTAARPVGVTWTSRSEDVRALTSDGVLVPARITVIFRPTRVDAATELGTNYYENVIEAPFRSLARSGLAKFAYDDLGAKSPVIEQTVTEQLRAALREKPIAIDRIAIAQIAYDESHARAAGERRAMLERIEQKLMEVRIAALNAEITRVMAWGESDAIRIRAQGEAEAIVLKGLAHAHAQDEIAKTLTPNCLPHGNASGPGAVTLP